ncbi:MAG: HD domain-containing phosphohydrolase [Motiliproteus sp.]
MLDHSISATILQIHEGLRDRFEHLCRIAVAIYDQPSDTLKTFAHSTHGEAPLTFYEVKLSDVPSLQQLAESGQPRVLDDLSVLQGSPSEHSHKVMNAGYHSSYTEPLLVDGQLIGFLFFDASLPGYFDKPTVEQLQSYGKILAAIIAIQFANVRTLGGAVAMAREFTRYRDEETANHLRRMSRYARLIAQTIAPRFNLDDEDVEFIYRFAPLHDIGKIASADAILLKPGKLTADEYTAAKLHVVRGAEMAQLTVDEFGLDNVRHIDMLRNIILCHHEHYDGQGYPAGLAGKDIPIEGRVVAVADVFDALTSERPYKRAWSCDDAFAYLFKHAGSHFDPICIEAALACADQFTQIQTNYRDAAFLDPEASDEPAPSHTAAS